ncbi:peptidoglycan DD-metalloendopeptidase family protein [Salinisphaera orenii]|uniref:peptidoglycan DD-metalloendopeptidase family protein n=1 Tax=Salinisphaera orenii TaxID=856731 RepID=UPI0013A6004D
MALALVTALGACSISQTLRPDRYTVQRGDTLYSVAQRYNLNWRKLARWNHIDRPYRIYVGESLTLKPYPKLDYAQMDSGKRSRIVRAPQDSQAQQQQSIQTSVEEQNDSSNNKTQRESTQTTVVQESEKVLKVGSKDQNKKDQDKKDQDKQDQDKNTSDGEPEASQSPASNAEEGEHTDTKPEPAANESKSGEAAQASGSDKSSTTDEQAAQEDNESTSAKPGHEPARVAGPGDSQWQWPASGALVQSYGDGDQRQGIEIGGSAGAPIYAVSSGTVVYNGTGLKGFGKLIIIKHANRYLSAYGFVRQTRVHKGQDIEIGQRIATMGLGPGKTPMLHFEIRHDGDSVNPARLLPNR